MPSPEEQLIQELDQEVNRIVDKIFMKSQDNLVEPHQKTFKSGKTKTIITTDTGMLLNTANVNKTQVLSKEIIYPVPYATDVEYGNDGMPVTPESLEKWVRRKIYKNKAKKGQVKNTAKRIAESLRSRGQSPDPFVRPAVESVTKEEGV